MAKIVLCCIDECGKDAAKGRKGFCNGHYKRYNRYGDPLLGSRGVRSDNGVPLQWLKDHVDFSGSECLKWLFADRGNGYGAVIIENGKTVNAHREMCIRAHGLPKDDKPIAAHFCGKGHEGCVNPSHLRWASNSENMNDKVIHGTDSRGEKSKLSKLTKLEVEEIRSLQGKLTQADIAKKYCIGQPHVSDILLRKVWQ